MRQLLLTLFFACSLCAGIAQTSTIDSLRQLAQTEKTDSVRGRLLLELSFKFMEINSDSSLRFAQQVYAIAQKSGDGWLELRSLNSIANSFYSAGNYPKALQYFLHALKKAESLEQPDRISTILTNLGNLHAVMGQRQESLSYYLRSKKIKEEIKDEQGLTIILCNMGDLYEKMNILDSARLYTIMADDFATRMGYTFMLGTTKGNLGNIYSKMNEPVIAMTYYRAGLDMSIKDELFTGVCEYALGMARLFERSGRVDSALHYAELSVQTARNGGFRLEELMAHEFLLAQYKKMGKLDRAFMHAEAMIATKDSIFNEEKAREIQALNFEETMRQQQLETARLDSEKERKDNIQYAIIGIAVIAFMTGFVLLSRSIIVNEKWIKYMGILGLLLVFEFINLYIHPFVGELTHHSPFLMLLIMVAVAALLIPLHHRLEHFITHKMTVKNKLIRLHAARKTVAKLEKEMNNPVENGGAKL